MTKKKFPYLLTFISLIFLVFLVAIAFIIFNAVIYFTKIDNNLTTFKEGDVILVPENVNYIPKPLPLVWMNSEEKNDFGINTTTESNIQVLYREPDGSIGEYKIIRDDKDIIKEY